MECKRCHGNRFSKKEVFGQTVDVCRSCGFIMLNGSEFLMDYNPYEAHYIKHHPWNEKHGSGIKYDDGKRDWLLLLKSLARELEQVDNVLELGAGKYSDDNWKRVGLEDKSRTRYWKAFTRHFMEIMQGRDYDDESGLPHLAHCITNLLFILWVFNEDNERGRDDV